jgi:hypothetical protein
MQILVGGTGGALRVPQLIGHGHQVIRNYRSPGRIGAIGAEPSALIQPPARVWRRIAGRS